MPDTDKKETRTETRMSAIELGIKEIKHQLERLTKKLDKAEEREKEQMNKIIGIENTCKQYNELRKELDEVKSENRSLIERIMRIEDNQRRSEKEKLKNTLEIFGIQKKACENPREIVTQLIKSAKVPLSEDDLVECYRAKTRDGTDKQIIVKVKSHATKAEIVKAMKVKRPRLSDINMQPENKLIYVNEMLTKETKFILYNAKKEATARQWHKVWVYAGDVYILQEEKGQGIKIENKHQLETLLK